METQDQDTQQYDEGNGQSYMALDPDIQTAANAIEQSINKLDRNREKLIQAYYLITGQSDDATSVQGAENQVGYAAGQNFEQGQGDSGKGRAAQQSGEPERFIGQPVQVRGRRAFSPAPVPRNEDGSVDRRTAAGRMLADDDVMELQSLNWKDIPFNEDQKTVDQRKKIGRILKAAGLLKDNGELLPDAQQRFQQMYATNAPAQPTPQPAAPRPFSRPTPSFGAPAVPGGMAAGPGGRPRSFE